MQHIPVAPPVHILPIQDMAVLMVVEVATIHLLVVSSILVVY